MCVAHRKGPSIKFIHTCAYQGVKKCYFSGKLCVYTLSMALNSVFVDALMMHLGPNLESKDMRAIFQKKDKNKAEKCQKKEQKGQNIWKLRQKCTKFENILKKDGWLGANFSQSRTRIFKNFSPVKTIVVPLGETNIGKLLTTVFILISPLPSHPPPPPFNSSSLWKLFCFGGPGSRPATWWKRIPITRRSTEVSEIFRNTFFIEHLWTTALGCL